MSEPAPTDSARAEASLGLPAFALAAAAVRTFVRAPIFFTALAAAQLLPAALMRWAGPFAASTTTLRTIVETLAAQLLLSLVQAPMIWRALQLLRGQPPNARDTFRTTLTRALPMVGLILLQSIIVALGSIALLLPGIVAYLMLFIAAPVCVADRAGPLQSLSRSTDLTRGARWRIFGAILLLLLPALVIVVATAFLASTSVAFNSDVVFDITGAFFGALLTILSVVVYEDRRKDLDRTRVTDVFA